MKLKHLVARSRTCWRVGTPLVVGGGGLLAISSADSAETISHFTRELLRVPAWLVMFAPLFYVVRDYSHGRLIRGLVWSVLGLVLVWRLIHFTDQVESLAAVPLLGSESQIQRVVTQLLVMLVTAGGLLVSFLLCDELVDQSREHQLLLDNAPALISRSDTKMRYLAANKRYAERFRRPVSEIVGSYVWEVIGRESWEQVKGEYEIMLRTGQPRVFDVHVQHKTPSYWLRVHLQPKVSRGKTVGYHSMILDITETKIAETQAESERELLRRILDVQEQERRASALDLHDGMIQYCVGAKMMIEACRDTQAGSELERAAAHLETAINEGRRLITEWRHPVLEESGLEEALRHRAAAVQRFTGIAVTTSFDVDVEIPHKLKSSVYRIAYEALSNIARHSEAERATLQLRRVGGELRLQICDCGRGFSRSEVHAERFGLIGIEERARLLGGKASIESVPGIGTQVSVAIPCDAA